MASSAFGFARAVETLPNYFEFGKSLVGQGKDDLDRAAKEKAYAGDLGLRASELALRDEMDRRQMDYRMQDLERQREMDKANVDYHNRLVGLDRDKLNQVEVPRTNALVNNTNSEIEARKITTPAQARNADAQARVHNATADEAEYERKQRVEMDNYNRARNIFAENPFDPRLNDELRNEFAAHYETLANPNAGRAYKTVNDVIQGNRAPTQQEIALVGNVLQPMIDFGGKGQTFLGFEPAQDGSGVHIRLKNADGKEVYMTKGRTPVDQGDQADVFSQKDIGQIMGHIRDIASWQDSHPELRQDIADANEARMNTTTGKEYRQYMEKLQRGRLARELGEEKAQQHDAEWMTRRSDKIIKDLGKMYDEQMGDITLLPEEEQTRALAAKNAFLSTAKQRLNGASKDQLMELDAPDIFNVMGPVGGQRSAAPSRGGQFHSPVVNR